MKQSQLYLMLVIVCMIGVFVSPQPWNFVCLGFQLLFLAMNLKCLKEENE